MERDKLQHEMYWNKLDAFNDTGSPLDKLQHEMYWNVLPVLLS